MNYSTGVALDGYHVTRNTEDGPVDDWAEYFTIRTVSDHGRVFVLVESGKGAGIEAFTREADAREELAAIDHNPDTRPDLWTECDPVYGSDAWDEEAERNLACFEADCYGEPRPRW